MIENDQRERFTNFIRPQFAQIVIVARIDKVNALGRKRSYLLFEPTTGIDIAIAIHTVQVGAVNPSEAAILYEVLLFVNVSEIHQDDVWLHRHPPSMVTATLITPSARLSNRR